MADEESTPLVSTGGESFYRSLVENATEGIITIDSNGQIIDANPAIADILGYTPTDLVGNSFTIIIPDRLAEDHRRALETYLRTGESAVDWDGTELRLVHQDGHEVDVEVRFYEYMHEGNRVFTGMLRNITERKEREQELEELKDFNEELVENAPVGLLRLDEEFRIVYENPKAKEIVGVPEGQRESDAIGQNIRDLPSIADAGIVEKFDRVAAGETVDLEFEFTSIYGREAYVKGHAVPLLNDDAVDGALILLQDVTERKRYEHRLEQQIDNLQILNQMLRHDIRNDLQVVRAYTELIEEECTDQAICDYIETVLESADDAVDLTLKARDLANAMLSTEAELEPVNLRHSLQSELDDIQSSESHAIVTCDTAIPDIPVRANEMLNSIFRNLLKNAIEHNDKDTPEIHVSVTERPDSVLVNFADNGPGVPDDKKAGIFGKGEKGLESEGTGIGLYLVHTLVETFGGEVWVEDNEPEGAEFIVELPKAE